MPSDRVNGLMMLDREELVTQNVQRSCEGLLSSEQLKSEHSVAADQGCQSAGDSCTCENDHQNLSR